MTLHPGIQRRFDVSEVSWVVKTADVFEVAGTWRVVGRISIALLSGLTAGPYAEFDRILCQLSIRTSSVVDTSPLPKVVVPTYELRKLTLPFLLANLLNSTNIPYDHSV